MMENQDTELNKQQQASALFRAVISGNILEVEHLVKVYNLSPGEARDKYERTLLHHAAHHNKQEMFEYLVTTYQLDPNHASNNGARPMHEAAYSGHKGMFNWIVDKYQLDPATKDGHGRTSLRYAAYNGQIAMVDSLIARGLDPNEPDIHGKTPLEYAAENGKIEMVDYLASIIMFRKPDCIHPCKRLDEHGKTLLHKVAFSGNIAMFDHLVHKYGMNPNSPSNNGATPMHEAAYGGQVEMLRHLATIHKVDITIRDKNGQTPLDYAKQNGKEEVVNFIHEHSKRTLPEQNAALGIHTSDLLRRKMLPCSDEFRGPAF